MATSYSSTSSQQIYININSTVVLTKWQCCNLSIWILVIFILDYNEWVLHRTVFNFNSSTFQIKPIQHLYFLSSRLKWGTSFTHILIISSQLHPFISEKLLPWSSLTLFEERYLLRSLLVPVSVILMLAISNWAPCWAPRQTKECKKSVPPNSESEGLQLQLIFQMNGCQ